MAEVRITAIRRETTGKGPARRARAANRVPAIVYGRGSDPVPIEVDRRELALAYRTDAGLNVLLDIELDGEATLALTKELQRDPVKGTLLHADFLKIDRSEKVEVEVPVHTVGQSPGVAAGGVLEQPVHTLHVRCLPGAVPESIDVDISGLEVGGLLRLTDLPAIEGVEVLDDLETIVASVAAPISVEQLEAMEAAVTEGVAPVEVEAPGEETATPPEGTPQAEGS